MAKLIKTKFPGIYYKEHSKTKVKTYIARIKIIGIINTNQIVGYSNDSIKTNPSIAYQKRAELINKLKNGESIRAKDNPSLETYFDNYMLNKENSLALTKNKVKIYRSFFKNHIYTSLKHKNIKQITKEDFQKVIDTMVKNGNKPSFIDTVKTCFSPIFNNAIDNGLIVKNIINGLKFPEYDSNRYFTLPDKQVKELVNEIMNIADNQYRVMFMFLLRGRRAGEVLSLRWSNIDLEKKTYIIRDSQSKVRKNLIFSLDDELIKHLEFLEKRNDDDIVFISPRTKKAFNVFPVKLWKQIKKNVGIKDMRLHDFRHLIGFILINNNVAIESVSSLLGHANIKTTQRYSNMREKMSEKATKTFLSIVNK